MSQIKDQATIVGRVHARLKDAAGPMTIRQLAESLLCGTAAVQYAAKVLHTRGIARKVPYRPTDGRGSERFGWEYIRPVNMFDAANPSKEVDNLLAAFAKPVEDIRIKVNEDKTITIVTGKIRITIEVPI